MTKVKIIKNCPECNSELTRVKDQLFCTSKDCIASKLKRVQHFAKTMKIKGLGEKTVEKLGIEDIEDIYLMIDSAVLDILGQKLGEKLLKEIEYSKVTSLEKLLPAFSIPLIGITAARKLNMEISTLKEITFDVCKKAGLGDKASQNLCDWLITNNSVYKKLPLTLVIANKKVPQQSLNIKVCMTGKLNDYSSRDLAATYLRSKGITVVSGVSKTLDYLINEDNKPSSKLSKANSYGISIITIKQLIEENIND